MFMKRSDVVKFCLFVLAGVFLISSSSAAESTTESNFVIPGCTFSFGGEDVSVSTDKCSTGVADGYFFCGPTGIPFITNSTPKGCSFGDDSYTKGDNACCPYDQNMFCNGTSLVCENRLVNCEDQLNENDCNTSSCFWMDESGECSSNPRRNYDCSYYKNNNTCILDRWKIGESGVGTEICGSTIECDGKTFSVPEDGCGCAWYDDAPAGERCQLKVSAGEMFYSGIQDKFECSNVYSLGDCTDGTQAVSWFSKNKTLQGFPGGIPNECLAALDCLGGESTRFCGEPAVKLPVFSFFSFLLSFFIIGIYYFLMDKFKYKKEYKLL
jgi:hypothetical protein